MRKFPKPIQHAANAFMQLPGVGPKTALRYVYRLLKLNQSDILSMAKSLEHLAQNIESCRECRTYTDGKVQCDICLDPARDQSILCVIAESRDIGILEATDLYKGRYWVVGGVINPMDGMTPEALEIPKLIRHVQESNHIDEVILGFAPDMTGEATMLYLTKQLQPLGKRVTRLARGLPMGADLEYADEVTLGEAIRSRKEAI